MAAGDFDKVTLCGWAIPHHRIVMDSPKSREQIIRESAALGHDRAMCAAIAGCPRSEVDAVLDRKRIERPEPMPRMITLPLHRRPHSDQQKLKIREPRHPETLRSRLARLLISCALRIDFHAARRQFLDNYFPRREAADGK